MTLGGRREHHCRRILARGQVVGEHGDLIGTGVVENLSAGAVTFVDAGGKYSAITLTPDPNTKT